MTAREKMIAYRESINADYKFLSSKCGVSSGIIAMVEHGHVTHPNIVSRLQKLYSLSDLEAEELLPLNRRLHGGNYDPDRYVVPENKQISIANNMRIVDEYGAYQHQVVIPRCNRIEDRDKKHHYQKPKGGY